MSRLLLDTHALLWWLFDSPQLGKSTRKLIASRGNEVFVSSVSLWEVALKQRSGKLSGVLDYLADHRSVHAEAGLRELTITHGHAVVAGALDWPHRDPFDRMLVSQSRIEQLELVTQDERIRAFHPSCRW
ncbi:MAG TPA: type II toxin-antitoxin system VapC family toxin [Polyangiales bacterium]|nr:type II toxin-antitoxin system VapC family toxin [Polyangiales bacterium]